MVEFSITKADAEKLMATFEGRGVKTREFIGGKPDLHIDVSKGIMRLDFFIEPTFQCQMKLYKMDHIGNNLCLSGKGNMIVLKVIE